MCGASFHALSQMAYLESWVIGPNTKILWWFLFFHNPCSLHKVTHLHYSTSLTHCPHRHSTLHCPHRHSTLLHALVLFFSSRRGVVWWVPPGPEPGSVQPHAAREGCGEAWHHRPAVHGGPQQWSSVRLSATPLPSAPTDSRTPSSTPKVTTSVLFLSTKS